MSLSNPTAAENREDTIAAIKSALREMEESLATSKVDQATQDSEHEEVCRLKKCLSACLRQIDPEHPAEGCLQEFVGDFIANIPTLAFAKDVSGRYTHINRHFEIRFGVQAEAVIGKTDLEIFPPEQAHHFQTNDQTVFTTGASQEFEERAEYFDGIHISIVSKFPLRDCAGEITGLCGIATDITERKRIEDRLRASTADLAEAQRIAHFGSWESDFTDPAGHPDGTLRWSDEMYRIAGFEPGTTTITREKFYQMVHPDDREAVRDAVGSSSREHRQYSIIHRLIRPSGEVRVVHETAHLFFDPETGKLARMFGTAHDITEQRETEHRFRQVTENIQEVFWLSTADKQQLLYVSPSYEAVWGRTCEELYRTPQTWLEAIHEQDRPAVIASLPDQRAGTFYTEYRITRPDGSERWIADRSSPIRDGNGQVYRIAGVALDISERKRTEMELARSNRSLQMLTACHESLIRATDENVLIQEICNLVVEMGGYRMAWVGYATKGESRSITPMASAGVEDGYLAEINLGWGENDPTGQGPAGQAIREGKIAVYNDISESGGTFFWKEAALKRGYHSVICLPLADESGAFGILALYSDEAQRASTAEQKLLQDLAEDLSFGISNLRSRAERQRAQEVVLKVAHSVSTAGGTEFFASLTKSMVEAVSATGGAIGRLHENDRVHVDTLSFYLRGKELDNVCYNVKGTPCETVVEGNVSVFQEGIQQRFPDDHMLTEFGLEAYAGIPLRAPSGEVTGLMAVFFDRPLDDPEMVKSTLKILAARVGAEIERQEADARIREQASLLDKARDAIIVRDLEHHIVYWNKSAERLYGWKESEATGKLINKLLYRDDAQFHAAVAKVISAGEWLGELDQIDREGRSITIEGRWTLVHDEKGRPKGVLAINTDITERKKLEAQFLRTQRMESIGTLAGGIAHDLNNVLAPILMSIQLLRRQAPHAGGKDLLDILEASAQRGSDLVRQVLSFARGVEGQKVPIDPSRIVKDIEKIVRDTFPKNIQAVVRKAPDLWSVQGDPTQLHQVLMNLCVNARDAMPEGGMLTISFENVVIDAITARISPDAKAGPYVRITVSDTGSGMPREIIDKIFEPFFTTKDIGQGTGLGLSTTLAIVKSHGGFFHVESAVGKGSQFHVYFPTLGERPVGSGSRIEQAPLPTGNGELILVVDDETSVRDVAKRILERFGYRVILAAHGAEAVELYQQQGSEIALVLTDMAMPIMDGPATIRALRAINPATRIIGSSGLSTNSTVEKAIGDKLDSFIPKPYTTATILKAVRDVLDRKPA